MAKKRREREVNISGLCLDAQRARRALLKPRTEFKNAVKQYIGNHLFEEGTAETVPVNLISLYVGVMLRSLVPKNPRLMLSTFARAHKPMVSAMQSWANQEIERSQFKETLQRIVVNALFGIGIAKVALAAPPEAAKYAWHLGAGQAFMESIDFDDFVFDIHARRFEEVNYIGHRYRVPLDVVKDSKVYGKSRKQLEASSDRYFNPEGDERISVLQRGYYSDREEFQDYVDLWEFYLPQYRMVLTLADDQLSGAETSPGTVGEALRQQNWIGPETGPYKLLGYSIIPGSSLFKAPIHDLIDLHMSANESFRKVMRTVSDVKEITGVRAGASEDGERVLKASHGQMIRLDDPKNVNQIQFGVNTMQPVLLVATALKDLFSFQAGNLDIMGGLSPQAKTAHQDAMLNENSSRTVSDMQDRTVTYTASVLRSLCWYWHHDPFTQQRSTFSVPGMPEASVERTVGPQQRRQMRFEDMDIQVDPYSMQHQTPQQVMQSLDEMVKSVIIPMMPVLQQNGVVFDINAYLKLAAQLRNIPALSEIVTIQEPPRPQESPGTSTEGPRMPAQTERTYIRENMPGRTRQGNDMMLQNRLAGLNAGGAQRNGEMVGA